MTPPGVAGRRLGVVALLGLAAGCASGTPAGEEPGALPPLPAAERSASEPRAPEMAGGGVAEAVASGNRDLAYALTLRTLERCGTGPLGQQALLLVAAAELDPRNPDPRLSLALEATQLVAEATDPDSWTRTLSESLHLIALRLGAREPGPQAQDEGELRWRARRRSRPEPTAEGSCDALPWPPGRRAPADDLPSLDGPSYPARVAWLQRKVAELEGELERLRRITKGEP